MNKSESSTNLVSNTVSVDDSSIIPHHDKGESKGDNEAEIEETKITNKSEKDNSRNCDSQTNASLSNHKGNEREKKTRV